MQNTAYHQFIQNNLGTTVQDSYGEPYVDMLRYEILSAAIDEDPDDRAA